MTSLVPEPTAPEQLAVAFARVLRGGGLSVPIGCVLTFGEGLAEVGLEDRSAVYWTARTTLIRRPTRSVVRPTKSEKRPDRPVPGGRMVARVLSR